MENRIKETEPLNEDIQLIIDQLYAAASTKMEMPDGSIQEVNPEGNLGLLACGYTGIVAWRKKREELYGEKIYSPLIDYIKKVIEMKKMAEDGTEKA